ncbi:bromodomain-containing protein 8 isoform X2 [Nelusetta ayraudi]|uniref:bromodomain-containing protein 8 isoform X2 n=1 Tax=Nelusetta ayraudi TaxID=303726 RepID=UPI003F6F4656
MAHGVGKHKLLVNGPTEPWSVREKLCLATSVMKSGDQNWVSVSRAIKPFAESGRPPDWFSQKHCASKYSELLETTEAPKRKRGEKGEVVETIEDVIVRRLTTDRIEELKKLINETQEAHRKLKREAELIQAGHLDSKLEEIWEEILRKKKVEEEEAELNRKNTFSAYQARQVAKTTPKRTAGVTVHSPSDCGSPSQEFSPGDPLECLTLDLASTKNAVGSTRLIVPESSVAGNDSPQKKSLCQKATPPPSPLLSELLKKGSILATKSRLIEDGDVSVGNMTGSHDLQLAPPLSQASGAPMLSRLLEAGPAEFSAPLSFMVSAVSASSAPASTATPILLDLTAAASTEMQKNLVAEDKVSELTEEDVAVSYIGDELDLKTVGDIIAIIEEKAQETAEALDAAAVEAALSLCEENGHALSTAWDAGPFQPHESSHPSVVPPGLPHPLQGGLEGKTQVLEVHCGAAAQLPSLCGARDNCLATFPPGLSGLPPASTTSRTSTARQLRYVGAAPLPEAGADVGGFVHQKSQMSLDVSAKRGSKKWAQLRAESNHRGSVFDDSPPATEKHPKERRGNSAEPERNASGTDAHNEVMGSDAWGEEEGDGARGSSSEPDGDMELEPVASGSEDGFGLRRVSSALKLHMTADSVPSSPASSQFSVGSEDLEALQAHKIWKKAIMLVWRAAANHRYANVFLQPVTEEIAPGYHSIVHRPMDLATIKKNIEIGLIRTTAEFQRDIMLMFQNAVMYNSLDHDVYHMALEMQRDVLEQIQQFLATQLIMETSESGVSAKSLRGRESTRKQDSTDKDAVSMSSPAFLLSLFDGGTRGRRCAIEADLKLKK